MISRIVQPQEFDRTEELFCIAFEAKEGNEPYLSKNTIERFASFTEEGDMMAFLCSPAEEVLFDGSKVKMSCVGGVSCLPHYRKGGALKAAFVKSLDYAYETGVELSCLFPFSSEYYRRFGYEYVIDKVYYKLSFAALKAYELPGRFYLNENGSELSAIKEVYEAYSRNYNFMFTRDGSQYFENFEKNCPSRDGKYTYVYKTDEGETPKAVMSFEKTVTDDGFNMQCNTFWYTCPEGLKALLTHAKGFSNYYKMLQITMPVNVNLQAYIDEWALYPMEKNIAPSGMMRVINVEKTFMAAQYIGSGEAVIEISDRILAQNNGTFKIVFENGKAVSCEKTELPADAKLSMPEFSRCILGAESAEELMQSENAEVNNIEPLKKVFYHKANFIDNYF